MTDGRTDIPSPSAPNFDQRVRELEGNANGAKLSEWSIGARGGAGLAVRIHQGDGSRWRGGQMVVHHDYINA